MTVYQVLDCLDYGDGVSNDVLAQQEMLRQAGYQCEIYTKIFDEKMKERRIDIDQLHCEETDLLLHHYSGYSQILQTVLEQPCKKVLVYHNITPPEFVTGDVKKHCEMGLEQLKTLKDRYEAYVGDSQFNLNDLIKLKVTDTGSVLPIPVEFGGPKPNKPVRTVHEGAQILFVGRYAPNKKQEDIIDIFSYFHKYIDPKSRLRLIGNPDVMPEYTQMLREKRENSGCTESIELLGKVSDEELQSYYLESDALLCTSEHEGFCIPLLEAMWHQLPVFAYDAGAVRETMGQGGVVFTDKSPVVISYLLKTVLEDETILREIIEKQNRRLENFSRESVSAKLQEMIHLLESGETRLMETGGDKSRKLKIQMQGPFETSYSLAQINRFLIEAMHEANLADVSIHCTEGTGDYTPSEENLKDKPLAKFLWKREKTFGVPDVAIRNMFPPVTTCLTAQLNFQAFGWEEDRIPQEYIRWFNKDLDGIGTMSDFVTNALRDSGLKIPVRTMGVGVRLPENYEALPAYPLKTKKKIRFLHISSAFPRKGVDVLLETFFDAFTAQDDVCLVLKTFPNIHNTTVEQLEKLRKKYPNGPEVEHIDMDLPEEQLYGLYKTASCYVHCARGEGFGLPVTEAMLAKIPTIVCNNTGLADFAREDTCLTVGYTMVKAHSHLTENSRWAEPDRKELKERLRSFAFHPEELGLGDKIEAAYRLVSEHYSWEAVARRWMAFIGEFCDRKKPTVDMVTTWNSKCGIAEFARYHYENSSQLVDYRIFPDSGQVLLREDESFVQTRSWRQTCDEGNVSQLIMQLMDSPSETVHIQYNLGFLTPGALARLCEELENHKKIVVTFHATKAIREKILPENLDRVVEGINRATSLVVHQAEDADNLIALGCAPEKIVKIPHGQVQYTPRTKEQARKVLMIRSNHVIGSYGFLLPHKGIEKTIEAVAILKKKYPDILYLASCSLYDIDLSREYYKRCRDTILRLGLEDNVLLFTDFLKPEESIVLLQACDATVMAYDKTNESASGAVRFCVAAGRPLITTKQNIFKEFEDCSCQIEDNTPEEIAAAVEAVFRPEVEAELTTNIRKHVNETSWHRVIRDYLKLY